MHPKSTLITLVCPVCGTTFQRHPYVVRHVAVPTCSRPCSNVVRFGTVEERFRSQFTVGDPDSCWEWNGGRDAYGYGSLRSKYRRLKAHRVSYEVHIGAIPDDLQVLHQCDNPACVNPAHLFLGTHADNMEDKIRKGRHRRARKDS